MKIRSIVLTLMCAAVGSAVVAQAPAADPPSEAVRQLPITTMTCQQLLQAGGDDRNLLLALFHGYVAGKADKAALDTVKMSFATDAVIDHCIEKPSDPLLAAFAAAGEDGR
jgi:hypothetical protein